MERYPSVRIALVAQLDRVQASEAWGRGFDSRRARHIIQRAILKMALWIIWLAGVELGSKK